ncbi:GntR family transcriptional regulator [Nocardioides sp. cx-173]|uniref:GntR family transcriptional regulator n=1 Tax=Nocardioides sp. cx-173 TaxID=2898796 RepID=UPI001E2A363F|nr:GntR family transcriptional regulator [Nocardioides sp. cx-173]MCD4527057.1 GntR family transcriptional regulator [Nocardioides sp. cx-173]UGB41011.1 GntR family transcriptional regulator [Nocardioides sp. cx-173]
MTEPTAPPSTSRLRLTTARDLAQSALRDLVLQGSLAPGDRVNEVLLAEELGISRGPLREAIQGLASEGLLQIVRHKGAFVTAVDADELRDLYELRSALEGFAVRVACAGRSPRTPDQIAALATLASSAPDDDLPYSSDLDFHHGLVELAGNQSLLRTWTDVHTRISLARARSARQPERAQEAAGEHAQILEAIDGRQGARATRLLAKHLWRSYESAASLLGDSPDPEHRDPA